MNRYFKSQDIDSIFGGKNYFEGNTEKKGKLFLSQSSV